MKTYTTVVIERISKQIFSFLVEASNIQLAEGKAYTTLKEHFEKQGSKDILMECISITKVNTKLQNDTHHSGHNRRMRRSHSYDNMD